jgi:tRNA(Arg) A34 adenosine deaminase TadA
MRAMTSLSKSPAPREAPVLEPNSHDGEPTALDARMMRRALALARRARSLGEVPVGAVVYRLETGEIIASGYNRREKDQDPGAHAECLAMRAAAHALGDWRLSGCGIAVTLEPCPMCAGMIVNARVSRVVYGASDPKAGAVRSLWHLADDARLNHRAIVVPGVLANVCATMLSRFFENVRRGNGKKSALRSSHARAPRG